MKRNNGNADPRIGGTPPVGRAAVIHPALTLAGDGLREPAAQLEEAVGLARAIGLDIETAELVRLKQIRPATYLAKGVIERFAELAADAHLDVVIVDTSLTPVQQRNLERALNAKVIDRTGLILEIFGARAQTYEGRLQVELAALNYQRSRLVRSWTHLERQRGGHGFLGGPGERQIEIDRQIIGVRITKLERDLASIRQTRALHRRARQRVPFPVVALVGYTNAGKSTLFNQLTHAGVAVKDMLFATLDPTLRVIELPSGRKAILGDTVGFISDLPTQLVAAFRATLEDVEQADVIVHVRDISHPDNEAQKEDVLRILAEIGVGDGVPIIEVLNKIDHLDLRERDAHIQRSVRTKDCLPISALKGTGCEALRHALELKLSEHEQTFDLVLNAADGAAVAWLYAHGHVLERVDEGFQSHILVALDPADKMRFDNRFRSDHA